MLVVRSPNKIELISRATQLLNLYCLCRAADSSNRQGIADRSAEERTSWFLDSSLGALGMVPGRCFGSTRLAEISSVRRS